VFGFDSTDNRTFICNPPPKGRRICQAPVTWLAFTIVRREETDSKLIGLLWSFGTRWIDLLLIGSVL